MSPRRPGWYVDCPDFRSHRLGSPQEAQAWLDGVLALDACHQGHQVVFVAPDGVKVRRVKEYTAWTGRRFIAFERVDQPGRVDVVIREARHSPMLLTGKEARQVALLHFA